MSDKKEIDVNSGSDISRDSDVFHISQGAKQFDWLVGPGHALLIDFQMAEKIIGKNSKEAKITKLSFGEIATLLKQVQNQTLVLMAILNINNGNNTTQIENLHTEIDLSLNTISEIAAKYIEALKIAAANGANTRQRPLILQNIASINTYMNILQKDVSKCFAKMPPNSSTQKLPGI